MTLSEFALWCVLTLLCLGGVYLLYRLATNQWHSSSRIERSEAKVSLGLAGLLLLVTVFFGAGVVWYDGINVLVYVFVCGSCFALAWTPRRIVLAPLEWFGPSFSPTWRLYPHAHAHYLCVPRASGNMTRSKLDFATWLSDQMRDLVHYFIPSTLQFAQGMKDKMKENEEKLLQIADEVCKSVWVQNPPLDPHTENRSVGTLLHYVNGFHENGNRLLGELQKYVCSWQYLSTLLSDAPNLFRKVSAEFTARANVETDDEDRDDYLDLASGWLTLAARAERRLSQLQSKEPQLIELLARLQRTVLGFEQLEQAISDCTVIFLRRAVGKKFIGRYRQYSTEFEEIQNGICEFHDAVFDLSSVANDRQGSP
jgi:hypothetical protein